MTPLRYALIVLLVAVLGLALALTLREHAPFSEDGAPAAAGQGVTPSAEGPARGAATGPASQQGAGPVEPLRSANLSLSGTWRLWTPRTEAEYAAPYSVDHVMHTMGLPGSDKSVIDARLPGTVQEALMEAEALPSPLADRGMGMHRWVSEREWWLYQGIVAPAEWKGRSTRLELSDVSGEVDAWINGESLPHAAGEQWVFNVQDVLEWPADDGGEAPASWLVIRLRHPREPKMDRTLLPLGIRGTVRLRSYRRCHVDHVAARLEAFDPRRVSVRARARLVNHTDAALDVRVTLRVLGQDRSDVVATAVTAAVVPGQGAATVSAACAIDDPKLWWPHGLGPQDTYLLQVTAASDGQELSSETAPFGVREVAPFASDRESAYERPLTVNRAQPLAVMASVWQCSKWVTTPDCDHLIRLALAAGINALHVKGGIESDAFYSLCDQRGMMVFQHLSVSLRDDPTASSLAALADAQRAVQRLGRHPSLVLWTIGEMGPQPLVDERIRELAGRLARDTDPTRPFVPVHDDTSPLQMWTPLPADADTGVHWTRTTIERSAVPQALCQADVVADFAPGDSAWEIPATSEQARRVLTDAQRYGPAATLNAQVVRSRLDQTLAIERQAAALMAKVHSGAGIIAGTVAPARPGFSAGLAQWGGRPMPALHWLKRRAQGLAIFVDLPDQTGPALIVPRGGSLRADLFVSNRTGTAHRSLLAAAKLTDLSNRLIDRVVERVDLPSECLQWVARVEPTVPMDCKDELLLLQLALHDSKGRTLASGTLWLGVSPNCEDEKAVDVTVVAEDKAAAAKRWGFLQTHGVALTILQAPRPSQPQPSSDVVPAKFEDDGQMEEGEEGAWNREDNAGTMADTETDPHGDGAAPIAPAPEDDPGARQAEPTPIEGLDPSRPRVIILDAATCAEGLLAAVAEAVKAGAGLLLVRGPGDTFGSALDPLMPADPVTQEKFDYGEPAALRIPGHPMAADVDVAALVPSGEYYTYKIRPHAVVVVDRGRDRPAMLEAQWGQGRIAQITENLAAPTDLDDSPGYQRLTLNAIGYLANLSFPKMRGLRKLVSRAAYRGLGCMPQAHVSATSWLLPSKQAGAQVQAGIQAGILPPTVGAARARARVALCNTSNVAALLCELEVAGLPEWITVTPDDDAFHLAPGETREVTLAFEAALPPTEPEYPMVVRVRGFNVEPSDAPLTLRFGPTAGPGPPKLLGAIVKPERVPMWDPMEVTLSAQATCGNPFKDASVRATFVSPSGRNVPVNGFYDGNGKWRVRFAPGETGEWQYRIALSDLGGKAEHQGTFLCVRGVRPGFVRVSERDTRRLAQSDGSLFTIIGGGCFSPWEPWATGGKTAQEYLDLHAAHRMNAMRVFLYQDFHRGGARDAMVNLLAEGTVDRFDLPNCRRLDEFMQQARERNVYVIMALFDHWPVKKDWKRFAYAAGNGGPCLESAELFTNADVLAQQKFFADYVAARWGAFGNLLAWELWNEADLVNSALLEADGPEMAWHRKMAQHIRSRDAHGHLLFTSFSSGVAPEEWYAEPWNQLLSYHHYLAYLGGTPCSLGEDLQQVFGAFTDLHKPLLLAELGYEKKRNDTRPDKRHYLRAGAWTMLFKAGGVILWDDNDFRITLETRQDLERLSRFFETYQLAALEPAAGPLDALGRQDVSAWLLSSPTGERYGLYVHNTESHSSPVEGACLPVPLAGPGLLRITWVDPKTGEVAAEGQVRGQGGLAIVEVPTFKSDLAGVMVR